MRVFSKVVCFFIIFQSVNICHAVISFPFVTTFYCDEWTGPQATGDMGCGIVRWGNDSAGVKWDQITTDANFIGGGGGRGMRQWVIGNGDPAVEPPLTQGKLIVFPANQYEVWIRFYVRYQSGFYFHASDRGGQKVLYFKKPDFSNLVAVNVGAQSEHLFQYGSMTSGVTKLSTAKFEDFFGSPTDGSWHYIEFYMKSETVDKAPFDGVVRMWCDGELVLEDVNINLGIFSTGTEIGGVSPQHNFHGLPLFDAKYIDFDDIAIFNSTPRNRDAKGNPFIGPVISPVNNLRI